MERDVASRVCGMKVPQIAPMSRRATTRQSSDSVWPLRNKDGLTWAEVKEKDNEQQRARAGA